MKWIKDAFNFYLDASIHVSLAVFALVRLTGLIIGIKVGWHLSLFVFFGAIACYNFIKYGVEAKKYILVANRYHKKIQILSYIALVLALYNGYFLGYKAWFCIGGMVLLVGLYALPVLPKARNLRSWGAVKIFMVALVWAGVTVILPVLTSGITPQWDFWVEAIQRFVLVFILLVPFEIRDLKYDSPELKTIPQRIGVANTKFLGSFATLYFFFLTFLKDEVSPVELILKGVVFLVLGGVMFATKRKQSKYFSSFWVESIPVFWYVLALFFY